MNIRIKAVHEHWLWERFRISDWRIYILKDGNWVFMHCGKTPVYEFHHILCFSINSDSFCICSIKCVEWRIINAILSASLPASVNKITARKIKAMPNETKSAMKPIYCFESFQSFFSLSPFNRCVSSYSICLFIF